MLCPAARQPPARPMRSSAGCARRAAIGLRRWSSVRNTSQRNGRARSRGASTRSRNGCTAATITAPIPAARTIATSTPNTSVVHGRSRPASTPPSGTPACLTENNRLRCRGGAKRCSTSVPAEDGGPIEKPMRRLPTSSAAGAGTALNKAPATPNARPTCRFRSDPKRRNSGKPSSRATTEPPVISDDK